MWLSLKIGMFYGAAVLALLLFGIAPSLLRDNP
jgi:hypothetical protein